MENNTLTEAIISLFKSERFYAELVLNMDRVFSDKIPLAGVCVGKNIELHINLNKFGNLSLEERVAVLKHECQHILNDHIPRSKEIAPEVYTEKKISAEDSIINKMKHVGINMACDFAINPGIPGLPEGVALPKDFGLKDGLLMEEYFHLLKDNEKAKHFMEFDDHPLWGESEEDTEMLRGKIKKLVKQAANRAGTLSSSDEYLVSKLLASKKNWKAELKRFAASQIETNMDTSRKKRNRRYGITQPGYIKTETLTLGVAIDTSGSVSDQALEQFMAEIGKISKYAKIYVVEADSEVKNSYEFNPKKQYKISGRGGTAYQPAIDYFTENYEIDGLIYFGDMDAFDEQIKKPKYPVLWAIVGNQDPPVSWGSRTNIEVA